MPFVLRMIGIIHAHLLSLKEHGDVQLMMAEHRYDGTRQIDIQTIELESFSEWGILLSATRLMFASYHDQILFTNHSFSNGDMLETALTGCEFYSVYFILGFGYYALTKALFFKLHHVAELSVKPSHWSSDGIPGQWLYS
ncbi:hypothetical protein BC936DRAFT_142989 [Jimgerdemannia flammicorona]|uniref:Uncharacterized protein n=1 Tax=Jimgerdemannia flammicorona TaxID=994334 RepID=A0A433DEK7_9FUNG|nr:hypothetical protein BC936DRAFT_142989 [Jimgerdemannia flammicorona]